MTETINNAWTEITGSATPVTTLADRAVLVHLSISQWSAAKTDTKINREIAEKHGSREDMGNYRKYLVARKAIISIRRQAASIRAYHYLMTLPWRDGGDRVLSNAAYFAYAKEMRSRIAHYETLCDSFCSNYPQYKAEAKAQLNGLYDPKDYPDENQIRLMFASKLEILPIPQGSDFRLNVGSSELQSLKTAIARDTDERLKNAMLDVWQRMRKVVSNLSERMKSYDESDPQAHPFRDTLVSNISDLLDVIPVLNLTDDPNVQKFAADIRTHLTQFNAESLRDSKFAREHVAQRADQILADMSQFMA